MSIWRAALASCDAALLVEERLRQRPIGGRVLLLALGKPAAALAEGASRALGDSVVGGLVVAPAGGGLRCTGRLRSLVGAHPIPDRRSRTAGQALWDAALAVPPDATPLVLLAGGGSALAVLPAEGLTLPGKVAAHRALVHGGLPIREINGVRAHLSRFKGGGWLRAFGPRHLRVEVLSDVGAGDVAPVASGPCSPDRTTYGDAIDAIGSLSFPAQARAHLEAGARGEWPETVKPGDPLCEGVQIHRLAGPLDLRDAAALAAARVGFRVEVRRTPYQGDMATVREEIRRWLFRPSPESPTVLVGVGEAQIRVPARCGRGGRAQHLVLSLLPELRAGTAILVGGSDGQDGLSEFAGAAADWRAARRAAGSEGERALRAFDSARAVASLGIGLPATHPRTNLTDLFLLARGPVQ